MGIVEWLNHASLAFGGMFAVDLLWAAYTKAFIRSAYLSASAWATLLMGATGLATLAYVHEPVMLLPAMCGAFVGTYIGSKYL